MEYNWLTFGSSHKVLCNLVHKYEAQDYGIGDVRWSYNLHTMISKHHYKFQMIYTHGHKYLGKTFAFWSSTIFLQENVVYSDMINYKSLWPLKLTKKFLLYANTTIVTLITCHVSHKRNILQIYGLDHATLRLMNNTQSFIVAQSSVILDEFTFEKNFRCFLDDNYTDTTCNKGKMKQRR